MDTREEMKAVSGGCFCGAVRFEFTLPSLFCAHCHCSMCRRNHGASYVTWVGVLVGQFRIVAGEDKLVRFKSSEHGARSFCTVCGTSQLCTNDNYPERIDVPLANLDDAADFPPQAHVFFSDRAEWTVVGDSLPHLGGTTGIEPM